ncbi:MAG TPA: spore coat protein CotJB [Ruminococcus sp.]|nr:spore coat protein CotJB [Ruminococcus sp.]
MRQPSLDSMEKADLLRTVQAHSFAMYDLALYLDTHPADQEALAAYLAHKEDCKRAAKHFAERFGALNMQQIDTKEGWAAWSNTPWPWEKEAN